MYEREDKRRLLKYLREVIEDFDTAHEKAPKILLKFVSELEEELETKEEI